MVKKRMLFFAVAALLAGGGTVCASAEQYICKLTEPLIQNIVMIYILYMSGKIFMPRMAKCCLHSRQAGLSNMLSRITGLRCLTRLVIRPEQSNGAFLRYARPACGGWVVMEAGQRLLSLIPVHTRIPILRAGFCRGIIILIIHLIPATSLDMGRRLRG